VPLVGLGKVTDLHLGFGPHDFREILRYFNGVALVSYVHVDIWIPFVLVFISSDFSARVSLAYLVVSTL
jgi:hypothetical protein